MVMAELLEVIRQVAQLHLLTVPPQVKKDKQQGALCLFNTCNVAELEMTFSLVRMVLKCIIS